MKTILVSALFLSLISLRAEAAGYCASASKLSERVNDCFDNEIFSEAAINCQESFEANMKKSQAAARAGLKANQAAARKSQVGAHNNSTADYSLSIDTLNALLERAQTSQAEVDQYRDAIAWPEDADEDSVVGDDFEAFLAEESCYKDNRDVIDSVLEDFDSYIAELEEARDAAAALKGLTTGHSQSATSLTNTPGVSSQPGRLNTPSTPKNPGIRPSDISGTKKKEPATK